MIDSYFVLYNASVISRLFIGRNLRLLSTQTPLQPPKVAFLRKFHLLWKTWIEKEASLATLWNIWGCPSMLSLHCSCLWDVGLVSWLKMMSIKTGALAGFTPSSQHIIRKIFVMIEPFLSVGWPVQGRSASAGIGAPCSVRSPLPIHALVSP